MVGIVYVMLGLYGHMGIIQGLGEYYPHSNGKSMEQQMEREMEIEITQP